MLKSRKRHTLLTCLLIVFLFAFIYINQGHMLKKGSLYTRHVASETTGNKYKQIMLKTDSESTIEKCRLEREQFWNTSMQGNRISSDLNCLVTDGKENGLYSYFISQNFENVTCPKRKIGFAETNMPRVSYIVLH